MIANAYRIAIAACTLLAGATLVNAAEVSPELIAKAKQEGQLTYYTDLIVDQIVRPLTSAFEAKYGIRVSFARADSQVNIIKLMNEQAQGRPGDVGRVRAYVGPAGADRRRGRAAVHRRQRRGAAAAVPRPRPLLGVLASFRAHARHQYKPCAGGAAAEEL